MLERQLRKLVDPPVNALASNLRRAGISAKAVTGATLVLGFAAALFAWQQIWWPACACWVASALCDLLDGAVARAGGGVTSYGALLDTISDKLTETAVYIGLALGTPALERPALLAACFFLLSGYVSKCAQALGQYKLPGLAQRPERAIILTAGLVLLALSIESGAVVTLYAIGGLSALTILQRVFHLLRQARQSEETPHRDAQE